MRPDSRYTVCGRVEVIVGGSGAGVVDGEVGQTVGGAVSSPDGSILGLSDNRLQSKLI